MIGVLPPDWSAALIGLICGVLMGLAARIGRFCTLGALEDLFYGGSSARVRAWGVAIGVALIGTHIAWSTGWIDLGNLYLLQHRFSPLAAISGGALFGYGMALAGNCGYGALARLGGGDLRSLLIVLVLGVSAYIAQSGLLAPVRLALFPVTDPQGAAGVSAQLPPKTGQMFGIGMGAILLIVTTVTAKRSDRKTLTWGAVVGAAIALAFAGTGWVAHHSFDAVSTTGPSFVGPVGRTLVWSMIGGAPGFDEGCVVGVVLGAFAGSYRQGRFRWEACDDHRELRRQLLGAVLMGVGGVIALGCSIGQGLSAMSVLAYSAPLTLAAITAGAAVGLKQLITGFSPLR